MVFDLFAVGFLIIISRQRHRIDFSWSKLHSQFLDVRKIRCQRSFRTSLIHLSKSNSSSLSLLPSRIHFQSLCPSPIDEFRPYPNISYSPMRSADLRWNFEKFLIDRHGHPVKRFASEVTPLDLVSDIDRLVNSMKFRKYFLDENSF